MHKKKIIMTVFFCLLSTNSYAQDSKIEIDEYLDHLHQQFTNSKLVSGKQGSLVHQGNTHIELNVQVTKNKKGDIQSYVVTSDDKVNSASVHKLSFDIDVSQRLPEAVATEQLNSNTTTNKPSENTETAEPSQNKGKVAPWYKHFFTW